MPLNISSTELLEALAPPYAAAPAQSLSIASDPAHATLTPPPRRPLRPGAGASGGARDPLDVRDIAGAAAAPRRGAAAPPRSPAAVAGAAPRAARRPRPSPGSGSSDIAGASPCSRGAMRTARVLDPLSPQYSLASAPPLAPPADGGAQRRGGAGGGALSVADIAGAAAAPPRAAARPPPAEVAGARPRARSAAAAASGHFDALAVRDINEEGLRRSTRQR